MPQRLQNWAEAGSCVPHFTQKMVPSGDMAGHYSAPAGGCKARLRERAGHGAPWLRSATPSAVRVSGSLWIALVFTVFILILGNLR